MNFSVIATLVTLAVTVTAHACAVCFFMYKAGRWAGQMEQSMMYLREEVKDLKETVRLLTLGKK